MDSRWRALAVLTLARLSMGFQFKSVAAAAPLLAGDVGVGYADLGLLIGIYMLPGIVLAYPGGMLGRRFGDTRIVLLGLTLMIAGGIACAAAEGLPLLLAGRALGGVGGVLLNVLLAKMIADWFAERDLLLAMSVFVNAYPVGVGLALLTLGWLGEQAGWPAVFVATAALAGACLLLVLLAYRPHGNEARVVAAGRGISRRELLLVSLAGTIWAIFNGVLAVFAGFTPALLVEQNWSLAQAGVVVGLANWGVIASIQIGGLVARRERWARPLVLCGFLATSIALAMLPVAPIPAVVLITVLGGLPAAIVISMPATVLQPASRSAGMGVFYTWLYLGFALVPIAAGLLQSWFQTPRAAFGFASLLMLAAVPLYFSFEALRRRVPPPETAPVPGSA